MRRFESCRPSQHLPELPETRDPVQDAGCFAKLTVAGTSPVIDVKTAPGTSTAAVDCRCMARQQKLKVFKTAIGFHDAYVAAPSKKAALAAWGSDADLFARGMAELVTDEELSCEPLAHPGKVIKRLRGTVEEQLAALPPEPSVARPARTSGSQTTTRPAKSRSAGAENRPAAKPKPKPQPRPSRAKLDAAEADMAELLVHQEAELSELRLRQQALDRERARIEQAHERARRNAERALARERKLHAEKLERWSNGQGQA